jgi:hypothetical protein
MLMMAVVTQLPPESFSLITRRLKRNFKACTTRQNNKGAMITHDAFIFTKVHGGPCEIQTCDQRIKVA